MYIYLLIFLITGMFILLAKEYYVKYKISIDNFNLAPSKDNLKITDDLHTKYRFFLIIAILILGLVTGFRNANVGTDLNYTYIPNFNKILIGEVNVYSEKGFVLFNQILQVFSTNYRILIVVTSLIFSFCLCQISVKKSKNSVMCLVAVVLSTFYFTSLNNIRQCLAAIILIEGFNFIYEKKLLPYLITILIAFIFHKTAIIMIPIYFLINSNIIRKYFLKLVILSLILLPIISKIFIYIIGFTKYAYYFNSSFNNGDINLINILINFVWLIISLALLDKEKEDNDEAYALLFMQTIAFLIAYTSMFIRVSEMMSRLASYFIFNQILLIPYLVEREKERQGKAIVSGLYIISYGAYMVYFIILKGYHQALPFYF